MRAVAVHQFRPAVATFWEPTYNAVVMENGMGFVQRVLLSMTACVKVSARTGYAMMSRRG